MTIKQIDQDIEEGNSLKTIAQAYSEIANSKVKRIRGEAERNRVFLEEIGKVYALVKALSLKKNVKVSKEKERVCVLITSNNRFYGAIDSDLINFFTEKTHQLPTDLVIIGKMALDHFKTVQSFPRYQPIILERDQPNTEELRKLVDLIKDYNQVLVFYPKLKSLLVQIPQILDLSESQAGLAGEEVSKVRFIFEPELAKILAFFDSQVLHLLLEDVFLEAEVARTASRFISMDQAESSADKFIEEYKRTRAYIKRSMESNLMLENLASLYARREQG